ncbi:MAG TPA: hypothetical protein H9819_07820 [Candidatus Bacteroides merdipullorum]|uniref:Uncharacterized protein n=1 Tax=Candidatus Bacteroides merdipullorum TaxID=2838474 RepID=A0A9D2CXM4_9BACE|nr:hypothetical protein [Candidatus Bacteroides merdipullorum]
MPTDPAQPSAEPFHLFPDLLAVQFGTYRAARPLLPDPAALPAPPSVQIELPPDTEDSDPTPDEGNEEEDSGQARSAKLR